MLSFSLPVTNQISLIVLDKPEPLEGEYNCRASRQGCGNYPLAQSGIDRLDVQFEREQFCRPHF